MSNESLVSSSPEDTVLAIENDLRMLISYDEWAGREYGEDRVDLYDTAWNLYNAGYRKVVIQG